MEHCGAAQGKKFLERYISIPNLREIYQEIKLIMKVTKKIGIPPGYESETSGLLDRRSTD